LRILELILAGLAGRRTPRASAWDSHGMRTASTTCFYMHKPARELGSALLIRATPISDLSNASESNPNASKNGLKSEAVPGRCDQHRQDT
jgi:hypothetical protein